jgi:signal transduction histidine kinase
MGRGRKPAKSKEAKLPVVRKSPKSDGAKLRHLEKRLAESLEREQAMGLALSEASEQQKATSAILRIISRSPTNLQPVLDAIATNAALVCDAYDAVVFLRAGDGMRSAAHYGPINITLQHASLSRGSVTEAVILDRQPVHVPDLLATEPPAFPLTAKAAREGGYRTVLSVPMLRENEAIGALSIRRREVQPFTDQQIELLKTFADQAVIAIENVRLFTETREALERQTATSEILRVIGSSPTDVQPVFETIARSGVSVCAALGCAVFIVDGDMLQVAATHGVRPERLERFRQEYPAPLDAKIDSAQTIRERRVFHLADIEHNPNATASDVENARLAGYRTRLMIPMVRGDRALGLIAVTREAPTPFSDQQVALLKTFADQAVIAIENVRLFKELEARNRDLTEALDQQTATSEVLKVISRSTFDLQPVLEILIENATRLCGAQQGFLFTSDGELHHLAVEYNSPPAFKEWVLTHPSRTGDASVVGRVAYEGRVIQILDAQADAAWRARNAGAPGLSGVRSLLGVPMRREGVLIGVIAMWRTAVRPYTDKERQLVETFADQAVIAIENVRLVTELQARTQDLTRSVEQLTALGEVGRAVSSTLDLETVLSTIVSRAVQLSGLDGGVVFEYDEPTEEFVQRVATETGGTLAEVRRTTRFRKGEGVLGRTAITLEPAQVPDITIPGAYESRLRENLIASGIRAILAVPMVREDRLIGCLAVTRNHPGEFAAETIELLRTFATQSALAIQNARLFREIEEKSRQLEVASQHKSEFLANMSHELRTPLNAIIGFSEVLTDRMFGELNEKQEEYLNDIYASGTHLLSLINDILDLSKIEAGRMELELTDFHLPMALDNALTLVRERAGRRGIALHTSIDKRLGEIQGDERKIRQVLLNLLSNAIKFTPEGGRIDVGAVPKDGFVEVSVTDTGVGIAPEDQERVFEEFRQVGTADKKAEGTGLGLTLCRKFVELHGGRIWVKSQLGAGSTFTFAIPVRRGE